nr:MAG TPA: hypothetical protein [Caudoviricetes sp.]
MSFVFFVALTLTTSHTVALLILHIMCTVYFADFKELTAFLL